MIDDLEIYVSRQVFRLFIYRTTCDMFRLFFLRFFFFVFFKIQLYYNRLCIGRNAALKPVVYGPGSR